MPDELNTDEAFDSASEGLTGVDELDLAADREDRAAAESREEPAEETEEFEYETPDGKVVKLSAEQAEAVQTMMDAQERAEQLEAENAALKAKAGQLAPAKVAETPPDEGAIAPVAWDKVGSSFQEMLEEGRADEIGPALNDVIHRTIFTSPAVADVIEKYVDTLLSRREQGHQVETKFKEFVGDEIPDTEVKTFMAANPWAKNRETAILGIQKARLTKQIADLQAGKTVEVKAGQETGREGNHPQSQGQGARYGGSAAWGPGATLRPVWPITSRARLT